MKRTTKVNDLNETPLQPNEGQWKNLPAHIWRQMFSSLDEKDLSAITLTDKNLRKISVADLKRVLAKQQLIQLFPRHYYYRRKNREAEDVSLNYNYLLKEIASEQYHKALIELFSVARTNNLEKVKAHLNTFFIQSDISAHILPWEIAKKIKLMALIWGLGQKDRDGKSVIHYWQETAAQPILNYIYLIFRNAYGLRPALLSPAIQCRRPIEEIKELWRLQTPQQWDNMELFWLAVESNHVDMLDFLAAQKNIDVNAIKDESPNVFILQNCNALHIAAKYNAIDAAQWLITNGINQMHLAKSYMANEQFIPIATAVYYQHEKMVSFLLEKGLESKSNELFRRILLPITLNLQTHLNPRLIALMLEKGAIIGGYSEDNTALHWAVFHSLKIVKLLVAATDSSQLRIKNKFGESLLFNACRRKSDKIVRFLATQLTKEDFQEKNNKGSTLLFQAVHHSVKVSAYLINEQGLSVNASNDDGNQPIHFAETEEMVTLLLHHHADINATNNNGITPLINAFARQEYELTQFLLNQKAKFFSVDLLHEVLEQWIRNLPSSKDRLGKIFLKDSQAKIKKMIQLLVTAGFDFSAVSSTGKKASELNFNGIPGLKTYLIAIENKQLVLTHNSYCPQPAPNWLQKIWGKSSTHQRSTLSDPDNNSNSTSNNNAESHCNKKTGPG